jgi:hypothetical protein
MTVDEITGIDKEPLAARHEAAIKAKFGYVAHATGMISLYYERICLIPSNGVFSPMSTAR